MRWQQGMPFPIPDLTIKTYKGPKSKAQGMPALLITHDLSIHSSAIHHLSRLSCCTANNIGTEQSDCLIRFLYSSHTSTRRYVNRLSDQS